MTSDNANAIATPTQLPRGPPPPTHHQPPHPAVSTNAESIPCPRCDSNNTKFCYYNNYNLSQPRHFCKSCRRYWTHGGTLRNVPVGGGTRKPTSSISTTTTSSSSNKRPRCSPAIVSPCSSSSAFPGHDGFSANGAQTTGSVGAKGATPPTHGEGCGFGAGLGSGFSSLLSAPGSNTVLALGGYGPGYVPALEGIGFGFNRGVWPFPEAGFIEGGSYGGFRGPILGPGGIEAWNVGGSLGNVSREGEVGAGGLMDGEALPWPELAISMPGQGPK